MRKQEKKFILPLLALCIAIGGSLSTSWSEEPTALEMTSNGAESIVEGTVNVIATPVIITQKVLEGELDSAVSSAVGLPISGVTSASTGLLKVVSGVGKGIAQATSATFNAVGKMADSTESAVTDNLPSVDVDINVSSPNGSDNI